MEILNRSRNKATENKRISDNARNEAVRRMNEDAKRGGKEKIIKDGIVEKLRNLR